MTTSLGGCSPRRLLQAQGSILDFSPGCAWQSCSRCWLSNACGKLRLTRLAKRFPFCAGIGIIVLLGETAKPLPAGTAKHEERTADHVRYPDVSDFSPPKPLPEDEWLDAQKPVRKGNVQIELTRVLVGKIPLKSVGDQTGQSTDVLCQISLRITNRASASKIDYVGWQGNSFSSNAKLTDDVGNRYKGINFGFGTEVVGQVKSESIYPGKSLEDILVFEAPVDAAKYLNLELPGGNVGEEEIRFRLRMPRKFSRVKEDDALPQKESKARSGERVNAESKTEPSKEPVVAQRMRTWRNSAGKDLLQANLVAFDGSRSR